MSNPKIDISDHDLVKRIVNGNETHYFSILYDRHASLVYNRCLSFASSKEEAEDLTHDVFIKLFVNLRTFKGTAKFSTWLHTLTYNFCVNYVSRKNYKKNEKNIQVVENVVDEVEISEDRIFDLKTNKLKKALNLIDPNDKMILLMKYQDDFSIKEIQQMLEVGESAVKMRLKRAKEKMINVYDTLKNGKSV